MPRVISRSGREAAATCMRRYYWTYEYLGTGFEPALPDQHLLVGIATHHGLETFFRDPSVGAATATEASRIEYQRLMAPHIEAISEDPKLVGEVQENELLIQALVYAFLSRKAPAFLERYEILQVEKELRTPLSADVVLASRLDLLVRDRLTNLVTVINWKTSSQSEPVKLREKFEFNIQMFSEALAAEWDIKEPVQGTIPWIFYKGAKRNGTYSNQLLYFYEKNGTRKPDYTKGWAKVRADQCEEGLFGWIDSLPAESIDKHVFALDEILKDNAVVEDRLAGWVHKETEIMHVLESGSEADKLLHFPPREGEWCHWCPFKAPCYLRTTVGEMIESGILRKREDHHASGPATEASGATIQAVTKEIK